MSRITPRIGAGLTALLTVLVARQVAGDSPAHLYDLVLAVAVALAQFA